MMRNEIRGDVMKSQKGITLTSLAAYVVLIFVVLAILATVTADFQGTIKEANQESAYVAEVNKFNSYFLQEVKKQGNEIEEISEDTITFSSKAKYVFNSDSKIINLIELDDKGNANKTIKIAEYIENCLFNKKLENGKTIIVVKIKAKNSDEITREYVLNTEKFTSKYEDEDKYIYNDKILNVQENNI